MRRCWPGPTLEHDVEVRSRGGHVLLQPDLGHDRAAEVLRATTRYNSVTLESSLVSLGWAPMTCC
jgi:hypothetical protein